MFCEELLLLSLRREVSLAGQDYNTENIQKLLSFLPFGRQVEFRTCPSTPLRALRLCSSISFLGLRAGHVIVTDLRPLSVAEGCRKLALLHV